MSLQAHSFDHYVDSGESSADHQSYLDALIKKTQSKLGPAVVLDAVKMNERHPFYDEWATHVDQQFHQGC